MIRFLIGVSFCSLLIACLLPFFEANFPDLGFLNVMICVIIALISWSFIFSIWQKINKRANAIREVSKNIDLMMAAGMSEADIMEAINLQPAYLENAEVHTIKIEYRPISDICGYYNGEPIYERIKLSNGKVAIFDGVHDMTKSINPINLKESSMILDSGIIYTLEKQDA